MWTKIFAAASIIGGLYLIFTLITRSRKCTAETVGTVIGHDTKRRLSGGRRHRRSKVYYYPVVEFEANGQKVSGTADVSSSDPKKYADGTMLTVRYDPDNPQEFIIKNKSAMGTLVPAICMILLGVAVFVFKLY